MHHNPFNSSQKIKRTRNLWLLITTCAVVFVLLMGFQIYSTSAAANRQLSQSPSSISEIASLTLVNADTDTDIRQLVNNDVLNLATLPTTNLNVRANIQAGTSVGSVRFGLDDNSNFQTENVPPYYMAGDTGSWTPAVGAHVLTVTAFSSSGGGGTADTPIVINFTVIDGDDGGTPAVNANAYLAMVIHQEEPTATPTPVNTATHTPQPTNTPVPGTTNTPIPTNTATPEPTNTATPAPTNTPVAGCGGAQFEDDNGLIVIEIESQPAVGDWESQTSIAGYTGSSFYRWTGSNQGGTYGTDTIEYKIKVDRTGTYRFIWRSYNADSASDLGNDAFLRFPDVPIGDFYGTRGDSIVYPNGSTLTPVANGSGGDNWFKIFMSETGVWSWQAMTSDGNAHQIYVDFDQAGVYTMQISGRSKGYAIDRAVLYHSSISGPTARDETNPETLCTG